MRNVLDRPMFQAPMQNPEGVGITSGLTDPAQEQMLTETGLTSVAGDIEGMFAELDKAENPQEAMNAIRGDNKSVEERRTELAGVVGTKDANTTPETVLTLVQPTFAILEMAGQAPKGGIGDIIQAPRTEEAQMRIAAGETPVKAQSGIYANLTGNPVANAFDNPILNAGQPNIGPTNTLAMPYLSTSVDLKPVDLTQAFANKDLILAQYAPLLEGMTGGAGLNPEARIAALEQYMPKAKTTQELLDEYQQVLGESDSQATKAQAFLELMKAGEKIAGSTKPLLTAITTAGGEIAPGLQKLIAADAGKDRQLKLAALQEKKQLDNQLQSTKLDIANKALTDQAEAARDIEKTKLSLLQSAINSGIDIDQNTKKILNDIALTEWNANNAYGTLSTETWGIVKKGDDGKEKIDLMAVRRFQNGVRYLKDGKWVPVPEGYMPYDKDAFAARFPSAKLDLSKASPQDLLVPITQAMLDAGTQMTDSGYAQVTGFELNGNFFILPEGGDASTAIKAPPGFLRGKEEDLLQASKVDGVGRVYVTNKKTGETYLSKLVNPDGSQFSVVGSVYNNIIPEYAVENGQRVLKSGNPMVKEVETGGIPFARLDETRIKEIYRRLNTSVEALNVANQILPNIKDAVGPLNSAKSWTSNIIGPLSPDAWDKMVKYAKTERGRKQMEIFGRSLVKALALSDRYAVGEQQMIYNTLAQNPDKFWQDPELSTMKFAEIMRTIQNEINFARATINDEATYGEVQALPSGTANDPIIYSAPGQYDALAITAATAGGAEKLKGTYIYFTQAEANRNGFDSPPEGVKLQITGVDNEGRFTIGR